MKIQTVAILAVSMGLSVAMGREIDPSQEPWLEKYQKHENAPKAEDMLLNTSPEPDLKEGFVDLFAVGNLDAWEIKGGKSTFELKDGVVAGTCVPGEASTYLCTKKSYADFIFTCEMKDGPVGFTVRVVAATGILFGSRNMPK